MDNLYIHFSKAVESLLISSKPINEKVADAYLNYLLPLTGVELPTEIRPIFDSVTKRIISSQPIIEMNTVEANILAFDIIFMADIVRNIQYDL